MGRKPQYVNPRYKSLSDMDRKAREIKTIREIRNTIIANACYHNREMESQIAIAEKRGNMTDKERDAVCNSWTYCNNIANELIDDLNNFMKNKKAKPSSKKIETVMKKRLKDVVDNL
jgi:hypothetical protein